MSALLNAAQGYVNAEHAQEYVDNARTKKCIIETFFPSNKYLYDGTSKLLDIDGWIRKAPNNTNFLGAMTAQLDSFFEELANREVEAGDSIAQNVARQFGIDPSVLQADERIDPSVLQADEMKKRATLMSDQQCRDVLPIVIDLLGYQAKRVSMELEQRKCFIRTKAANKKAAEIYHETAKQLADKVDQLENSVQSLSSNIRTLEKQSSKTAAKLAKFAESVETYIGGVHTEHATDPLKRLTRSICKLTSLPSLTDANTTKKTVHDSLLETMTSCCMRLTA